MTRELAEQRVSERWEYLKLNKAACPIMFGMDVDNMVEHPEDYIEVASRPTGIAPVTDRAAVGDDSGGASSVCAPASKFDSGDGQFNSGDVRGAALQAGDAGSNPAILPSGKVWASGKPPAVKSLPVPLTGREGVSGSTGLREDREQTELVRPGVPRLYYRRQERGISDSQSLPRSSAQGKTGAGLHTSEHPAPWYFSCVRRGIDGFIADVDRVVDRETAEYQGVE